MPKHYESEITQFLHQYKEEHPGTEQRQKAGFNRLWNRYLDKEKQEQFKHARVAQKPYVYLDY